MNEKKKKKNHSKLQELFYGYHGRPISLPFDTTSPTFVELAQEGGLGTSREAEAGLNLS